MGARISTLELPQEDVKDLANRTCFTVEQVERLYRRFKFLDRDNSGTLSPAEFLAIPEFSMNPLNNRTLALFQLRQYLNDCHSKGCQIFPEDSQREHQGSFPLCEAYQIRDFFHSLEKNEISNLEVDFISFIETLSIFSPNSSIDDKVHFAFLVFNLNGDGMIKVSELSIILRTMLGDQMLGDALGIIVDRTVGECDVLDHDGKISLEEFRRIFINSNMAEKMTISV